MQKKIYTCDFCGGEYSIFLDSGYLSFKLPVRAAVGEEKKFDLCCECSGKLHDPLFEIIEKTMRQAKTKK